MTLMGALWTCQNRVGILQLKKLIWKFLEVVLVRDYGKNHHNGKCSGPSAIVSGIQQSYLTRETVVITNRGNTCIEVETLVTAGPLTIPPTKLIGNANSIHSNHSYQLAHKYYYTLISLEGVISDIHGRS